jgi:hypothetical protein
VGRVTTVTRNMAARSPRGIVEEYLPADNDKHLSNRLFWGVLRPQSCLLSAQIHIAVTLDICKLPRRYVMIRGPGPDIAMSTFKAQVGYGINQYLSASLNYL